MMTYESKSCALCLLVTAEFKAIGRIRTRNSESKNDGNTYCLQRFKGSCILYLHAVHSSRSTTFFVVFAFLWKTGLVWPP